MTDTATPGKQPSNSAYHVRDRDDGKKAIWTKVGSAWPHADGRGYSLQLDAIPLDGRIALRHISEDK